MPELVDGLSPSAHPVPARGYQLRVSLAMRNIGLDRTFHGGRSGYINSRLVQAAVRVGR